MESSLKPLVWTLDSTSLPLADTLFRPPFKASPEPTYLYISNCGQASFVPLWLQILEGPVNIKWTFSPGPIS